MNGILRSAPVALLFLGGVVGVGEAAHAQTVIWSATLEAENNDDGPQEGYGRDDGYGSLSSTSFTHNGISYSIVKLESSNGFTRMDFGGSEGHVERDIFGRSRSPNPVTLNIGSDSWMSSSSGTNFGGALILIFSEVIEAGNTYTVSITTTAPGAPQSLSATTVSSTEVKLSWSAPGSIGSSSVSGYKYRYKQSDASAFGDWTAIANSASLTEHTVGGLEDSTSYTFQMLAANSSGDGLHSGEVTASTGRGTPTVTLVLDRDRISEDGGKSTVTATLDQASTAETTVTVSASAVSPAMSSHFALSTNKVLTIAAEATSSTGTVTIEAVNNAIDDDDRQVTVSGAATNTAGITQPSSRTLTIFDDESVSTKVTLSVSPTRVEEGATGADQTVTVTAELDGDPLLQATEVTVSVSDDTAIAGTHYSAVDSFTVTIAAGQTSGSGTFTLAPIDDNLDRPDGTVTVTGTTTSELSIEPESGLPVKILDDDEPPAVTLVLDPDTIDEDGGKSTVTATLDRASINDIEITVSASPVAPAVTSDFTLSANKVLTIEAGDTTSSGTVTITANNNDVGRGNQRVTVSGSAVSDNDGDLTPPGNVTLTITEDDAVATTVTLTVSPSTVAEDATGSDRTVTVTAELDGARDEATPVAVSVTGGTAVAGTDYAVVDNFTVTIAARRTSGTATFTLAPVDDNVDERAETVVLTGTTAVSGLTVAPANGMTVSITDNDPRPQATLHLTPVQISENGGESTVTVTLDRPSSAVTTINVSHINISGTSGPGFRRTGSALTIAAGATQSTGSVKYTAVNNSVHTHDTALRVAASVANTVGVTPPAALVLTILEDDTASTKVTLSASPVRVSEGGGDQTVTLTGTLDEAARSSATPVRVSVSGGTAVVGTDFSAVEDFTFNIQPRQKSGTGTFTLSPVDNAADGADKTVTVTATTPDSVGLPVEPDAGLTIAIEDDEGDPRLSLSLDAIATDNTVNIAEKAAGFSISGDTGSEAGVSVSVAVGSTTLTTTSADVSGTAKWSVSVPADASYITGTSVGVTVSATKSGFTAPTDVTRTLAVDLVKPSVTYFAPSSLKVGAAVHVAPTTSHTDISSYSAVGLPSGLVINTANGVISGAPDTVETDTASVAVTVTDTAGNPVEASVTFPAVGKADQTLTGFSYSSSSVTFGDSAPTLIAPMGAVGTLSYAATPETVCTVDGTTGALTIVGAGTCEVTVTAASTDEYNEATAKYTVTVNAVGTLSLNLDAIATDDVVNIAEKTAGFSISGNTGSEAGVSVSVAIGSTTLTATSADASGTATWSVSVPAEASYISGTSVSVRVSASKSGFTAATNVTRSLTVDLAAPSVTYAAPDSLKVGAAVDVQPTTTDTDLASYSASGLPSGLSINGTTGAITGEPDTVDADTASVTVTVTDTAGNPADVSVTFPMVEKGDQSLTGFEYSSSSVTFGDAAPTLTAPDGAVGTLSYAAAPEAVCTVDGSSGALTIVGLGACVITVTAASTDSYNEATATYTVTVTTAGQLVLNLDRIAGDNTINVVEETSGFPISGDTGSEAGVSVSVAVGSATLTTTSADDGNGTAAWSVNVPGNASYITGTSVAVTVSASKAGFTAPTDVTRTLTVDLVAPTAPTYTVPDSLKLGSAITAMNPTGARGVDEYSAVGLPSGLSINASTGVISGTPDTINANTAFVIVRASDEAGNIVSVTLTFPPVGKGDQSLTGFEYSSSSITFGDTAPTLTAPDGAVGTLSYTATPAEVCTVVEGTGALTIVGVGTCEVTVTAASTDKYNEGSATYTVTVNAAGTLSLSLDAIATDNTVNIAERAAGFSISGDTGSEAGVAVSVAIGATTLTATSADVSGTAEWSVNVPAAASYITGTSVSVSVTASKTGYTAPSAVTRTLAVDLAKPSVAYTAPASLKVGASVDVRPTTTDTDLVSYSASGLPSGLSINATTGAITGEPDTLDADTAEVTVTVTDNAGNPAEVSITFPKVDKGDQSLAGFEYSSSSITFGDSAPTVTAPPDAVGTLSYTATPAEVCTVVEGTGALTIVGAGTCEVTVTAASTDKYNEGTAKYTVTVNVAGTLSLSLDAIATDNTVNIAEKAAGFSISGDTGSESGVTVSVTIGSQSPLTATSTDVSGTAEWSVSVPAEASYITGTSVGVTVSASKVGFTAPTDVERTLAIDLVKPAVSYSAPASLKVGAAVDVQPTTTDTDLASYSASGLPSGLSINATTGAITGAPDTVDADTAEVTVTVTDTAGNPAEVSITFPMVAKGDQTLTGFEYSSGSITFGDSAPTVTAPDGAVGTLSYAATPEAVCTVDGSSGALTIAGAGTCVITVTAASTDSYEEGTATYTVTVNVAGTLSLNVAAIATDNTVNIAEKAAGFSISGDTGSESGVTVSVTIGSQSPLTATSTDVSGTATWSVSVPSNASYITGTSVSVSVTASKTGYTAPSAVTRTLAVDLAKPSVAYTAPSSLKVGVSVDVRPTTTDTDLASYAASGLPSGLSIDTSSGAITGAPDTVDADTAEVTVTVTDTAGNAAEASVTFPMVAKGGQTLTGFEYSSASITFGDTAPTVTAPDGAVGTLSYTATPAEVCTVVEGTGALTIVGAGTCEVTVTAASTDKYNEATAKYTVTVNAAGTLSLSLDAIATDNVVNIAEKTAGFSISGDTGSEAGVTVSVAIGATTLTATSADVSGTAEWSVSVPAAASYITGTSVSVSVTASKTGYTAPSAVTRTLAVDLAKPAVTYTAPASLKVGAAVDVRPTTTDTDLASYSASGLPSGLSINGTTGVIGGTPDTVDADTASVTVTVTDNAGNPAEVSITFPKVDKGDQSLAGFEYSSSSITFGDSAPTVTAPPDAVGTLSYTATPAEVCTVVEGTGALTIVGAGTCEVTVTAASTDKYNEGTAKYTVTVNAAGTLSLSLDAIATDNTVNIAEKTAGFSISGDTGSEAGVSVSVAVGTTTLTATSADVSSTAEWSVSVPAEASYITGTSVGVTVSASKAGFTAPTDVERTLAIDLVKPTVTYTAPASLKVGAAVDVQPTTTDTDLASYSASGLPSGLSINATTGAITGEPDTLDADTAEVTVTVTDTAGNPAEVSITFPMVAKGDQTLAGFSYSSSSITFGDTAPTVTAPPDAVGTLSYTATPAEVCTVVEGTGALTIVGAGTCEVTVTAASTDKYNEGSAKYTVTVNAAGTLSLSLDAIATDNTVNIAEKAAGFSISGDTGSEAGVSVSVAVGMTTLTATSADVSGIATWSVNVPSNASYITGTSVGVTVSASKAGFTAPTDVTRTLAVDLVKPTVTYAAPASLKVGAAVDVQPTTTDTDLASYSASGLPSGLSIDTSSGAISGAPDMVDADTAEVTVTVTDTAGNPAEVSVTFPMVAKGDQTLTGFEYSSGSITFGDSTPTLTAPDGAVGTLSYAATPEAVCTVDGSSGALTIVGAGDCEVTVTAASTDKYNEGTAKYTVTVNAVGTLSLNVAAIATDNTVNITEKAAGFSISGDTGSEAGVSVSVAVGSTTLTATSADVSGTAAWSVSVPAEASYITGTSVSVTASASKAGFTAPTDVTRTLAVDLVKPTVTYTAPTSLKVGAAVDVRPTTTDTDLASYAASGLPSGLSINATTGAITGEPDTLDADTAEVTVTVTDTAGNPAEVSVTFPMVAKGDQTLTGFEYSSGSITYGDAAPTVTAPDGAVGTLSYAATPEAVCTVDGSSGALTIVGAGDCEVTVTAASTDKYNEATAKYTVTVNAAGTLSLSLDAIATDNTVNIAERAAGFSISGDTGSEAGVAVSVAVGTTTLTATSADVSGTAAWSVAVPAEASYITGTSVSVTASASKAGFTAPTDVTRTLAVDLVKPTVAYTAPVSLKVGASVDVRPTTTDTDLASYSASGLPSGLSINGTTGAITGEPDTLDADTAEVTVTVTDTAGNPAEASVTFPMVAKGDQTLTGFSYSSGSITFGDSAPTVTAPDGAVGTLSYAATPEAVCTVDGSSGALTITGAGACEVTVTAASTDEYNEGTAKYTVTVNAAGTLSLSVAAIATDNTVNIAEKAAGFSISGDTGSESGVTVSVTIGSQSPLTATSADVSGTAAWSVSVPAEASYVTGTSVSVSVTASKTGYTAPSAVTRTLAVDLVKPTVAYTAPATLKVGASVDVRPTTTDTDLASYSASGLPSGLSISATTGAITGEPDTLDADTAEVTVTVTDTAGNAAEASVTFPMVSKGDQTLTGFEYSSGSITYGDAAPTVTAPDGAVGTLSYAATPEAVCTVDGSSGALTVVGAGACEVTVTAASTDKYNEGTAKYTVTVNAAGTLSLSLDAIATDNTVNIAEKTAGFSISGDTGSEAGVAVSVAVGMTTLTATSADVSGTAEWSVNVPAEASYITGTSVSVTVSASKAGFTAPTDVTRTLAIDLVKPAVTYTAPASLKVGASVDVRPTTTDTDLASYSASGLPSGLSINTSTGAITGEPDTLDADTAEVTVTVTDTAGNPAEVSITLPAVEKGDQTLTGFEYSSNSITFGDTAPTVTAPPSAVGTLSYAATPEAVCTVDGSSGALTIVGAGTCEVTVTAASTDEYNEATAKYTVTVNAAGTLSLSLDAIATDNTVNIAEKTAGFSISGDTGSEAGVSVSVAVGMTTLTATSADVSSTAEWSVSVPAEASYITGTSVSVTVSASKAGFTAPTDVTRSLAVDLVKPSVTYTAPASLKVGAAVDVRPVTTDTDLASYSASGLPSGLSINATTGAITGEPDTVDADTAEVTVTVTDTAGNAAEVSITLPMVAKGDQSLAGFEYSASSITFGDAAPTVTAPPDAVGTLSYAATPEAVCTVDGSSGALTITGAGACEVTVTAASTDSYEEGTAKYTVTVNAAGTLSLNVAAIATDNVVNIAEKAAGFSISGDTGSEASVSVSVAVGMTTLTATSADVSGTAEWSVSVPSNASYITGTSVSVTVSASKAGFTAPTDVTRSLTVDLVKPSVTYTAPASLKVGASVDVRPVTTDTDLASYSASGLPSGLSIDTSSGAITGAPDTVDADTAEVTVTVTDTAGNPAEASVTFPAVAKGDQTLTGFQYSSGSITFGDTAPTLTAPNGAVGTLSYAATPEAVCTVVEGTGALTIVGAGACEVTVTAASTDKYNEGTAKYTVTVNAAATLSLSLDAIATDNTVNIAEKTAGFSISGDTGSEAGVSVSVAVGTTTLTATSADVSGTAEWSVNVPSNASYITGTSVSVRVSASKAGFTAPTDVTRSLAVDLVKPSVTYTAPASLKVGASVDVRPVTTDTDLASYSASGLPSGLSIDTSSGAISGAPDMVDADTAEVTVTVTDNARNPAEASVTFPMVEKGDQSLTGFEYSAETVAFGDTAPTLTAPMGAEGALSYTATPGEVCTVDETSGALTLVAVGECVITATAASDTNYNQATATFTVTVTVQEPVLTTPGKPRAAQISPGNGSVIVQWLAPSFDGGTPILHYEYCLQPMYQCDNQWVEILDSAPDGANHGRYAITRPYGVYTSLNLRAVNAQGPGPHVKLQAIARAGVPGAPTNLRSEAISEDYVKISWTEPAAPTGTTINGYSLERSRDGVTWAHDDGCRYPCAQQFLGSRSEARGTTAVAVRIGPLYTLLYYRIRTIFETSTPMVVSGIDVSEGFSEASPIIEVTTAGGTGSPALPMLGVSDGFGHEGENAAIVFDVTLTGSRQRTSPVTVSYRTQEMTALSGSDYTSTRGTLVFQPDETGKTVSVPIIDDLVEDSGEEFLLMLSNVSGAHLARAAGFGTILNSEDILSGFTLVDAAAATDVGTIEHDGTMTLDDPANGRYGIRASIGADITVNSVRFELSGAKTVTRTDNEAPFTLHAEGGEGLLPGAYTLQATAYPEADRGGNALQTRVVSFTIAAPTQDEEERTALSATLPANPYASRLHTGASDRPQVVVAFSEAVNAIAANTPSAVVTGGTIASARTYTEDDLSNAWIFVVTPDGDGDVTFTLAADAACDNGGICTASGTMLTQVPAARTLPGPGDGGEGTDDSGNAPLTASFSAMPGEHAGPGERFSFELAFSEAPEVGYRKVRDDAFTVTGGAVRIAQRLEKPSNIRWKISVEPSGWGDVAISLPGGRACASRGGICTGDNRMLASSPSAIVQGPAALSVADANASEGTGATLDFTVTLDRVSTLDVTVHYATADGTAQAGADYTATSGTLSFAPGDLVKTVSVPILDDAHDEGSETLTLTLSNASGARIRDAEATGTIENSDPIPQAWLARFGRTTADHVVDAVAERLEESPGGGSQVTLGGQRIPLDGAGNGTSSGGAAGSDAPGNAAAVDTLAAFADRITGDGAGTGRIDWGEGGGEGAAKRPAARALGEPDLLPGSSFILALGGDGADGTNIANTRWTAWGRAASSSFDGEADGLVVDGDVTTFTFGADAARGHWLGGVALAHGTGEGRYRDHADSDHSSRGSGTLQSTLTSVHPYVRLRASERLMLWGVLGIGTGDLSLELNASGTQPRKTWKTDTGMEMAAAGARAVLVSAADTGGLELAARGDARRVRMSADAVTGAAGAGPLSATESQTSRMRFMLEGSQRLELGGGQTLRPSLEVGLRHDGGDAETGTGIELGAGVSYTDAALGLTVEGKARGLLAHEDTDYREWGASGSVRIDPGAAGRGLSLTLTPAWGADTGGAERLWSARDARALAANDGVEPAGRLDAEAGYGLGAFVGRGLMTPFAGLSLSDAGNRTWRSGVRWRLGPTVDFGVEGALRETGTDNAAEHEIGFKLTARF